jgi:hypothetical protein
VFHFRKANPAAFKMRILEVTGLNYDFGEVTVYEFTANERSSYHLTFPKVAIKKDAVSEAALFEEDFFKAYIGKCTCLNSLPSRVSPSLRIAAKSISVASVVAAGQVPQFRPTRYAPVSAIGPVFSINLNLAEERRSYDGDEMS